MFKRVRSATTGEQRSTLKNSSTHCRSLAVVYFIHQQQAKHAL